MALSKLEVRFAVSKVDPIHQAVLLHPGHCPEHAGVVGAAERSAYRLLKLIDRPFVAARGREQEPHLVSDWAWGCHLVNCTKRMDIAQ